MEYTTEDYRNAPSGEGPLALEWKDKPHRLLYDLISEIETSQWVARGAERSKKGVAA